MFVVLVFAMSCASPVLANPTIALFERLEISDFEGVREALSKGANAKAKNEIGETVLHVCARVGDARPIAELVRAGALVDQTNALGQTPLHVAAAYGHGEEVRTLVKFQAGLLIKDSDGMTPAAIAAHNEEWDILTFLSQEEETQAQYALTHPSPRRGFVIPGNWIPVAMVVTMGLSSYLGLGGQ